MKLNVTVEIIGLEDLPARRHAALPDETKAAILKMPFVEKTTKSLLFVDSFAPRIIDNKAVHRYFPMLQARSFYDAIALLRSSDNLTMTRGGLTVSWHKRVDKFLDANGKNWSPSPDDILSDEKVWYVNSKAQPDQTETEFSDI